MPPYPFSFLTRIKGGRVQKVAALHGGERQGLPLQEAVPCSLTACCSTGPCADGGLPAPPS